ncbi:hypothetical protein K402DRAFT_444309 [Aulographum hederae CBS 113979]|uniref:MICOS complex subunit MIC60 n=1 Tax=Aulographum hederae CBS 113979 TaxID=1176131 RepID=A0A6G1HBC8_9PEZI|nr:hypothetical protein K402DRAFT_444309 [Aulographum hederae CBS 113979]
MLRTSLVRSRAISKGAIAPVHRPQWLPAPRQPFPAVVGQRYYADVKKPDGIILPGSQSAKADTEDIPSPPITVDPRSNVEKETIQADNIPLTPPKPEDVTTKPLASSAPTPLPPMGTGTATVAPPAGGAPPPPPPAPKKKPRRFRQFLLTMMVLSALGYAGGVYYSLVSDNFHDFFTEYVPFGEDAVGYFEEREFRKRFPGKEIQTKLHEQVRGEHKVTIPSRAGMSWKVADKDEKKGSDLGSKGAHVSAVEPPKPASPDAHASKPEPAKPGAKESTPELRPESKPTPQAAEAPKPAPPAALIDNINIESATEPVVQDVVKIINTLITTINADNAGGKYANAVSSAKDQLQKVINDINTLKSTTSADAEKKIKNAHMEFDEAAKELARRMQNEMDSQEAQWRKEYEEERTKLSDAYKSKLESEIAATKDVYEATLKNQLLEKEIELQRQFAETVRSRVESERGGRLGKLENLTEGVKELEDLTQKWNSVLQANLKTQHLLVAVEAVKAKLETSPIPKPFVEELAALKEVAQDDAVVNAAIASIQPQAYQLGIPTSSQLIDRFRRVAAEVRKAALLPENAGVVSHVASQLLSKVMFKKNGLPVGDDVESVLTRAEILLEEGGLEEAAREVNALQGWAGVLARDWVGEVRRVCEVKQALDVISAEARLQSLLVE